VEILNVVGFEGVSDPVKTEQVLFEQLTYYAPTIETNYVYVVMPLANLINKTGIQNTQKIINSICASNQDKKLFFICQHIQVDKLNFHGRLVFTPHATILDPYVPLPHYSCNYDETYSKPWEQRQYTFSFMGSFVTHPVRRRIYSALKGRPDCLVVDTGRWHFEAKPDKQEANRKAYVQLLGNTKFSLCPRGTGPSSIRIWESMAMGASPLIVSDLLKMPLERTTKSSTWTKVPENFATSALDSIAATSQKYNNTEYLEKFGNENLYKSVVSEL